MQENQLCNLLLLSIHACHKIVQLPFCLPDVGVLKKKTFLSKIVAAKELKVEAVFITATLVPKS